MGKNRTKANYRRTVLRLPDLDHSKAAVLNSLTSPGSRRVYQHAIEQFIAWYCSEPAWLSIASSWFATASSWKGEVSPPTRLISNSPLFGGWQTRRLTRGC